MRAEPLLAPDYGVVWDASIVSQADAGALLHGIDWAYAPAWINEFSTDPSWIEENLAPPTAGAWDVGAPQRWGYGFVSDDTGSGEGDLPGPETLRLPGALIAEIVWPVPDQTAELLNENPAILSEDLAPQDVLPPAYQTYIATS